MVLSTKKRARVELTVLAPAPVTAVERSSNGKLGDVSATYASQASCPKTCPLYENGCYGEQGYAGITTARLNRSEETDPEVIAQMEAEAIDRLSGKRDLRLHVVGDATTDTAARALARAAHRYRTRGGRDVWTYTHAWRKVRRGSWGAVSVLASCESTDDVKKARARHYATALVVGEFEREGAYEVDGVRVIPCPAQTQGRTCQECRLCMDDQRLREARLTIAFQAHGCRAEKVKAALC